MNSTESRKIVRINILNLQGGGYGLVALYFTTPPPPPPPPITSNVLTWQSQIFFLFIQICFAYVNISFMFIQRHFKCNITIYLCQAGIYAIIYRCFIILTAINTWIYTSWIYTSKTKSSLIIWKWLHASWSQRRIGLLYSIW